MQKSSELETSSEAADATLADSRTLFGTDPGRGGRGSPRVLFVDQTAQLGGAELSLFDIVRSRHSNDRVVLFEHGRFENLLREQGIDVSICPLASQVSTIRKDSGFWLYIQSSVALMRQVRAVIAEASGCSLFYANTPKAFVVSALAGWKTRKPVIYHLRDILSDTHFSRANRWLIVMLAKLSRARVIANSAATADAFVAAGGSAEAVSVVHNGFDPTPFDRAHQQSELHRAELRGALGLSDEPVVALFGRLAEWKGQHLALEAIRRLPDVHLLLVGDALFGEDEYLEQFNRLASDPALRNRVHRLGFRTDVPELMQASDIVIHCSTAPEPFGRVIVEAMLSRRPLIASRAGGAAEIVRHGETGLLFPPGSADELASAITKTLSGWYDAAKMVDTAYRESRDRFDLASCTAAIDKIIAHLAHTANSNRSSARPLPDS